MAPDLDELMTRVESLPDGVQHEIRAAIRACLDVVGPALAQILEAAAEHDLLERFLDDPTIVAALELCGLDPRADTPSDGAVSVSAVSLSPRPSCEICGGVIGSRHDHAADLTSRHLLCVCRACHLGLNQTGRYRSLPDRVERIADSAEPPHWWIDLGLPVELVFFIRSAATGATTAFYPGAAGVVESTLAIEELPVPVADDVEALLVRSAGRFEAWRVPVDRCYELAGLIKHGTRGTPVAARTGAFFDSLVAR